MSLALFAAIASASAEPAAPQGAVAVRLPQDLAAGWVGLPSIKWHGASAPQPGTMSAAAVKSELPPVVLLTPTASVPPTPAVPYGQPVDLLFALSTGF